MNFLLHLIFLSTFGFLFIISIIILKPFRIHRKRPVSTISLKVSYLLYLLIFLILAYLVLFFSRLRTDIDESGPDKSYNIFYFVIIILALLVPNLGILLRRKVKKFRTEYNAIFTGLNIFIIIILLFLFKNLPWDW